jgi:hypothetical protein
MLGNSWVAECLAASQEGLSSMELVSLVTDFFYIIHDPVLNQKQDVGFEVLTMVVIKSTIFWDIMLCSPLNIT